MASWVKEPVLSLSVESFELSEVRVFVPTRTKIRPRSSPERYDIDTYEHLRQEKEGDISEK